MSGAEVGERGSWAGSVVAVLGRPWLWPTALRQLRRLAPKGWWRRSPFLPVPDPDYLRFRLQTMYGGDEPRMRSSDVVSYLSWCRRFPGR